MSKSPSDATSSTVERGHSSGYSGEAGEEVEEFKCLGMAIGEEEDA